MMTESENFTTAEMEAALLDLYGLIPPERLRLIRPKTNQIIEWALRFIARV